MRALWGAGNHPGWSWREAGAGGEVNPCHHPTVEQTQTGAAGRPMSSVPLTSGPCSARPQLLSKANIRHFPSYTASLGCQISLPFLQARAGVHMLLLNSSSLPKPPPRSREGSWEEELCPTLPDPISISIPATKPPLCAAAWGKSAWPGLLMLLVFPGKGDGITHTHTHTQRCFPGSCHHPKARGWDWAAEG